MLIKMLGLVFAGVFVGAAALEMKTDRHGKQKERDAQSDREAAETAAEAHQQDDADDASKSESANKNS